MRGNCVLRRISAEMERKGSDLARRFQTNAKSNFSLLTREFSCSLSPSRNLILFHFIKWHDFKYWEMRWKWVYFSANFVLEERGIWRMRTVSKFTAIKKFPRPRQNSRSRRFSRTLFIAVSFFATFSVFSSGLIYVPRKGNAGTWRSSLRQALSHFRLELVSCLFMRFIFTDISNNLRRSSISFLMT